jgi:GNAT superfamily N-acetyltransferase
MITMVHSGYPRFLPDRRGQQADFRGQGRGVASALLEALLAWSASRGIETIFLGTTEKFHAAHRFYEKNGFTEIPRSSLFRRAFPS